MDTASRLGHRKATQRVAICPPPARPGEPGRRGDTHRAGVCTPTPVAPAPAPSGRCCPQRFPAALFGATLSHGGRAHAACVDEHACARVCQREHVCPCTCKRVRERPCMCKHVREHPCVCKHARVPAHEDAHACTHAVSCWSSPLRPGRSPRVPSAGCSARDHVPSGSRFPVSRVSPPWPRMIFPGTMVARSHALQIRSGVSHAAAGRRGGGGRHSSVPRPEAPNPNQQLKTSPLTLITQLHHQTPRSSRPLKQGHAKTPCRGALVLGTGILGAHGWAMTGRSGPSGL